MNVVDHRPYELLIGERWTAGAQGRTFDTLNPATGQVLAQVHEATAVGGNALSYDTKGNLVPDLAERWTIEDDGKTFRFFFNALEQSLLLLFFILLINAWADDIDLASSLEFFPYVFIHLGTLTTFNNFSNNFLPIFW